MSKMSKINVHAIPVKGTLMEHQVESVQWMLERELIHRAGGLLADDMGLGKTYQVTALLKGNLIDMRRSTLIVTMVSTVSQWQKVLIDFGGIQAFIVPAGHKCPIPRSLDVVLTSYSVFQSDNTPECLMKRNWNRIILDEGHTIKNKKSKTYEKLSSLIRHNQFRWILSGTPVQNEESELCTLLTWCGCKEGADERKKFIFRRTLLQVVTKFPESFHLPDIRTKIKYLFFKYPEERILYFSLFPKKQTMRTFETVRTKQQGMSLMQAMCKQRQLCVHPKILLSESKSAYRFSYKSVIQSNSEWSSSDLGIADTNITAVCVTDPTYDEFLITGHHANDLFAIQKRQLQKCNEEELRSSMSLAHTMEIPALDNLRIKNDISKQQYKLLADMGYEMDDDITPNECSSNSSDEDMGDDDANTVLSDQSSDSEDLKTMAEFDDIEKRGKYLDFSDVESYANDAADDVPVSKQFAFDRSTKFEYLCRKLMVDHIKKKKVLVFCQWKVEMKLLGELLCSCSIPFLQFDGDQRQNQRECIVYNFNHQPELTVLLIQIRAGGVGLNLQAASRVYITAPDWNPVVELQAIARAHRINQKKAVKCTRLVMAGTVEELCCIEKEYVKLSEIKKCLSDDDFAANRMGHFNSTYGKTVVGICTHYKMLESLRYCDM